MLYKDNLLTGHFSERKIIFFQYFYWESNFKSGIQ